MNSKSTSIDTFATIPWFQRCALYPHRLFQCHLYREERKVCAWTIIKTWIAYKNTMIHDIYVHPTCSQLPNQTNNNNKEILTIWISLYLMFYKRCSVTISNWYRLWCASLISNNLIINIKTIFICVGYLWSNNTSYHCALKSTTMCTHINNSVWTYEVRYQNFRVFSP